MTTTLQKTRVDLGGLMRVLGEALYSTPHVAIRELVQNAHDSCVRRRLEDGATVTPAISVTATPGTLVITDNGAGLTVDEIHAYLATVGAGYTRTLRDAGKGDGLIGYFGLGFLSAFAVSDKVEAWTCSYKDPGKAHRFVSLSGETYSVEPAEPRPVGTELRLHLRAEMPELGDADVVLARLRQYCCLLEFPVSLNGGPPVNAEKPPWRLDKDTSPLRARTLSLEFARRFESTFDPIVTIAIPRIGAGPAGLLWIQDGGSYATSDNRNVSVFVRGMLISDDERELLPRWAGFVGGVIESDQLHPTASRESLVDDDAYRDHAAAIGRHLVEGLARLAANDAPTWRRVLQRHNEALLGAALVDEQLFALVADEVTIPTTEGDLTMPTLLARGQGRVHLTQSDRTGVESLLLRALKLPIVLGSRFGAAAFCQRYCQRRGELVILGTQAGDGRLFQPANLEADRVAQLERWFAAPDREVRVRAFDPTFLPFAQVIDRDAELKRRLESDEADRRMGQAILGLARQFTRQIQGAALTRLYVNASSPAIRGLFDCDEPRRQRALAILQPLAELLGGAEGGASIDGALRGIESAVVAQMKDS